MEFSMCCPRAVATPDPWNSKPNSKEEFQGSGIRTRVGVVGSAENRASSAPTELGLGLSLAILLKKNKQKETQKQVKEFCAIQM